jgi:hypothetical protein
MYMSGIVKSVELCFVDSGAALQAIVPICVLFFPLSSGCTAHAISLSDAPPSVDPTRPHVVYTGADIISPPGTVQPTSCCCFPLEDPFPANDCASPF